MPDFPHLPLNRRVEGRHRPRRLAIEHTVNPRTQEYLDNRETHGSNLLSRINQLEETWQEKQRKKELENLPSIVDPEVVPVFLQLDPDEFDIESLKSFGIEIISEEEDGYIIGASIDNFRSLKEKIHLFLRNEPRRNHRDKAAQLWQIEDGLNWKLEHVLSQDLLDKWDQIREDEILVVDVGIACYVRISNQPTKSSEMTDAQYNAAIVRWRNRKSTTLILQGEKSLLRQEQFENLIGEYRGELLSSFIEYDDSFCCRIKISGKGLKDLVLTYQYVFEVEEYDPYSYQQGNDSSPVEINPEIIAPGEGFPKVCVIDSGMQESHRLIAPAIIGSNSKSYIATDTSTADSMPNGGHGTRVAGSILYPRSIPNSGTIQLPCFIENAKVLMYALGNVVLPNDLYPPELMGDILDDFENTRIFNLSVNSFRGCKTTHMSQWASAIDKLMFENDVLFIISAGNIGRTSGSAVNPGITEHLQAGRNYPDYLLANSSRIGSPGQSCFALTVGSVCIHEFEDTDRISFGKKDFPSSFSRTGLGIWKMIKPDVVEYGGDFLRTKISPFLITNENTISPDTVRAHSGSTSAIGRDSVGTSFSAPKVTHIVSILAKEFPDEPSNFYRMMIAQSARLPLEKFRTPTLDDIRYYGYGIPDAERATKNSAKRITFYKTEKVKPKQASIYSIKIPDEVRPPGEEYDVLIEVTLSYMSKPRRTRRRTSSYLSQWLSWESSKLNESLDQFSNRMVQNPEPVTTGSDDQQSIRWVIRENPAWSRISGLRRQDSSLQKSWCILKAYELPEFLSLAVVGHTGWDSDINIEVDYSIAVSFEVLNANIDLYERFRIENQVEVEQEVSIRQ